MAVLTIFAGAADGDILSNGASYIAAVGGAGTFTVPANSANELWVGQLQFATYSVYESFVDFDLSAMHTGQVCTSAVMQTWLITDNTPVDFQNIALLYDWGASVTSADWQPPASLVAMSTWWTSRNTSGIGAVGSYKSWLDTGDIRNLVTFLAGTEINFILASDRTWSGITPGGAEFVTWSSSNVAGTTQDPKLTVTFSDVLATPQVPDRGLILGGSTAGTFSSPNAPAAQIDAGWVVEWDFDNDGDFSAGVEDITAYVLAAETQTGREFPSGLTGETRAGSLKLTLDNRDSRFSYFNTASPLATPPFSLRAGRKIRIRTSGTVPNDPVLLARDRFDRADGALGVAETGQAWVNGPGSFSVRSRVAAAGLTAGTDNASVLDVGVTDMYVQATLRQLTTGINRFVGLYARWSASNNYTRVRYNPSLRNVTIADNNAGAFFTVATASNIDGWEGMTIGLGIVGQLATAYVGGVAVCSFTLTRAVTGTKAGLFGLYVTGTGRTPEIGDFHVWDHVGTEVPGILWTGDVTDLEVATDPGTPKTASVSADGRLVRLAGTEVASPRVPVGGAHTGYLVGDVLQRAGMLHPPTPLDAGAVVTGPIGVPDGQALELARRFEDTEQGFLIETQEGAISFQDSADRAAASSQAWFSDTVGVGQFPYSAITPVDRRGQLINRVTAGVAAEAPSGISWSQQNSNQHVDVTAPTVAAGDLLVYFIADSHDGTQDWEIPIWWQPWRTLKGAKGLRVYSRFCDGTESATVTRFRTWDGSEAGVWLVNKLRIQGWFESTAGIAIGTPVPGNDAAALVHGWGRDPTLFVGVVAVIGGTAGGVDYTASVNPPDGYVWSGVSNLVVAADPYEVGLLTAYKVDVTDEENSSAFVGFTNTVIQESVVFAVRGFNGSHTKATLENPETVGGDGRLVTTDNDASQADYNAILSHRAPSDLFASEADAGAYGASVVATYGQERPIIELSFWASSSAGLRAQAIARRVGHKITVTAASTDPVMGTGLGIERAFFIEAINHQVTDGGKLWRCTWSLSPA